MNYQAPICRKCKHYHVTWDKDRPHGCDIYKFKSHTMPSLMVKQESGEHCLAFEEKILKNRKKDLDLNRDDLW